MGHIHLGDSGILHYGRSKPCSCSEVHFWTSNIRELTTRLAAQQEGTSSCLSKDDSYETLPLHSYTESHLFEVQLQGAHHADALVQLRQVLG